MYFNTYTAFFTPRIQMKCFSPQNFKAKALRVHNTAGRQQVSFLLHQHRKRQRGNRRGEGFASSPQQTNLDVQDPQARVG